MHVYIHYHNNFYLWGRFENLRDAEGAALDTPSQEFTVKVGFIRIFSLIRIVILKLCGNAEEARYV